MVALFLVTVLRIIPVELPIFSWGQPELPQLELAVKEDLRGVRLEWAAPPQASGGILRATDDDGLHTIPLSASAVQAGSLAYGSIHGTTRFALAIQVGSSGWRTEEVSYLEVPEAGRN